LLDAADRVRAAADIITDPGTINVAMPRFLTVGAQASGIAVVPLH
jgi:hypothetical protein